MFLNILRILALNILKMSLNRVVSIGCTAVILLVYIRANQPEAQIHFILIKLRPVARKWIKFNQCLSETFN